MATVEATQRKRAPSCGSQIACRATGPASWPWPCSRCWFGCRSIPAWPSITIALLVVTCPCALGMATPLAVSVALGRAAKAGILFKGGEFMEELARPGVIVFDKTGTLTRGQPDLVAWLGDPVRAASKRSPASSIQQRLPPKTTWSWKSSKSATRRHRRARERTRAARRLARAGDGAPRTVAGVDRTPGEYPRPSWPYPGRGRGGRRGARRRGVRRLRPEAQASLRCLRQLGFRFEILSGDHQAVVDSVARSLDIPRDHARGGLSPEAKLARIPSCVRLERAVMVGDGVNGGLAAAATVGIAVHGGAETCLRAADVFATRTA